MVPRDRVFGGVDHVIWRPLVEVTEDLLQGAGERGSQVERHHVVRVGQLSITSSLTGTVSQSPATLSHCRRRHRQRRRPLRQPTRREEGPSVPSGSGRPKGRSGQEESGSYDFHPLVVEGEEQEEEEEEGKATANTMPPDICSAPCTAHQRHQPSILVMLFV